MTYDIFNSKAPAMPKPAKSTEIVKFLFSKASKYVQKTLVSMFFLYFTHMGMLLNFNTTTSFGRNYVAL